MSTMPPSIDDLAATLRNSTGPHFTLDPAGQASALALLRMLAGGEPVSPADLAATTGQAAEQATSFIDGLPGVYRDDQGSVVGFWGLTVAELPPHPYRVGGQDLFTWCAWDPLILTPWLGGEAQVSSVDPRTGEAVGLDIANGEIAQASHPDLTLSFKIVDEWEGDVIARFCHDVHLFTGHESARAWTLEHPGTFPISLEDGERLAQAWGRAVFPSLDPATS